MTEARGESRPEPGAASGEGRQRFPAAYRVLEEAIQERAFPGCAFGLLAKGEGMLADALGRFTYEEDAPKVKPETIFDIASVTKVGVTTAAAMLLWQRGQLDVDTALGELLPGFVVGRPRGDHARDVTLQHLLAHNSGLPGYAQLFLKASTPAELFRLCLELPIEAEPGVRIEYSDPGFILLGKALEIVMREDLAAWTKREIFDALEMRSTGFVPAAAARAFIPPTEEDSTFRMRRIQGEVQDENAWVLKGVAGHAGLFSNVPDLLRFAGEVMVGARGEGRLFEARTVESFAKRQGPGDSSQALGWDTPSAQSSSGRHFSQRSIGHLGYSGCSMWIDLQAEIAVVLLTNRTWPDRSSQLINQVRPAFHDAIREAIETGS